MYNTVLYAVEHMEDYTRRYESKSDCSIFAGFEITFYVMSLFFEKGGKIYPCISGHRLQSPIGFGTAVPFRDNCFLRIQGGTYYQYYK